jgi:YqxM protein
MKIRMKRLRKFRKKNFYYLLSMKLGIVFYLSIYTAFHLTGTTSAYFSDNAQVNGTFEVGTWEDPWDKSSLMFTNNKTQSVTASQCTPIEAVIKNGGDDMKGPVDYEVWWAEKGNPKNGVKRSTGQVTALKNGESLTLTYSPIENGNYMFKAMQRPGHPGKGELWSSGIEVKHCSEANEQPNTEQETLPKEEPPKQDEPATPPVNQEEKVEEPVQPKDEPPVMEQPDPPADSQPDTGTAEQQTIEPTVDESSGNQIEQ